MSTKIVLILGAGARTGRSSALEFSSRGYQVAVASRSLEDGSFNKEGHLQLRLDLSHPDAIEESFAKVKGVFGRPPSVVIYNGASRTVYPSEDPLSTITSQQASVDFTINTTSALIVAKYAVAGFASLPAPVPNGGSSNSTDESPKGTFIYIGNKLNVMPWPLVLSFGMGKTAAWHMIASLNSVLEYRRQGFRFFYTDERNADGSHVGEEVDGNEAARWNVELAEGRAGTGEGEWYFTFVKGVGFRRF